MVDSQISAAFEPYLRSGERIVWTGRPGQGVVFSPADMFLIPFSLFWTGTAVFIGGAALTQGTAGFPFDFVPLLFVVFGLYFTVGRFLHDAWGRSRMAYALTNQRALVLRRLISETLLTAGFDSISVRRGRDGRGTLDFDRRYAGSLWSGWGAGRGFNSWTPSLTNQVSFVQIPDVMAVYALAQQQAGSAPTP